MYKTILTHLNSSNSAGVIADVGAYIAEKHGAHLVGVHHSRHVLADGADDNGDETQSQPLQQAEAIQQIFENAASARKLSFEWLHKNLDASQATAEVASCALSADLVVSGGHRRMEALGAWYNPAVRIVLEAGRPVLLVPADAKYTSIGKRITIAWNHTRESARAAFDALPLLQAAEAVRLVTINGAANGALSPEDGLPRALERHGVRVYPASVESTKSPGEELLTDLVDHRADLLVMGCYGHTRLLEMVLGSMTRHVLAHVQVPVLLAH